MGITCAAIESSCAEWLYTDATLVFPGTFYAVGAPTIWNFSTISIFTSSTCWSASEGNPVAGKTKVV
jgi:hypothetical protein